MQATSKSTFQGQIWMEIFPHTKAKLEGSLIAKNKCMFIQDYLVARKIMIWGMDVANVIL